MKLAESALFWICAGIIIGTVGLAYLFSLGLAPERRRVAVRWQDGTPMSKATATVIGCSLICVGGVMVFTNLTGRDVPGWIEWTGATVFGIAAVISGIRDFRAKNRA